VHWVTFDYGNEATFDPALEGVDRVFLLSPSGYPDAHELTRPFIERAGRAGVNRFVVMTAFGADADETIPLRKLEHEVQASGAAHTILRPNWFMQNFNHWFRQPIRHSGEIRLPAGEARVSFIDTRDIATVAAAALTDAGHEGRAYHLTGPDSLTHHEVATKLAHASGRHVDYENISDQQMRDQLSLAGLSTDYIELLISLFQAMRQGYAAPVTDDFETATGRRPIDFDHYAADHATHWHA